MLFSVVTSQIRQVHARGIDELVVVSQVVALRLLHRVLLHLVEVFFKSREVSALVTAKTRSYLPRCVLKVLIIISRFRGHHALASISSVHARPHHLMMLPVEYFQRNQRHIWLYRLEVES